MSYRRRKTLGRILLAGMVWAALGAAWHGTPGQSTPLQSGAPKAQSESATNGASHAQTATVECANTATAETTSVAGPGGASAVLRVETEDDHSKESHECNADYELQISLGGDGRTADILTSNAEYGRRVTVRLEGFTRDGKRVIGILSEGGKDAATALFDYHIDGGEARLVDLSKMFLPTVTEKCSEGFDAIGTTVDGAVVVELEGGKECGAGGKWAVDSDGSLPKKISARTKITGLYGTESGANQR